MDLMDLLVKLSLDKSDFENGLNDAEKKGLSIGSTIGKAVTNVAKITAGAVAAGATALAAISKQAVEAYASYEQLEGGVETLFGLGGQSMQEYAAEQGKTVEEIQDEWLDLTTGQRTVLNNADQAYKTAGLSANEYMETVTSFSASLISSLGGDTKAAAEKADQAVVQMADNANKMGSDISSIQNAYQGFAKQNYTMLDNLKLGYGGTKEEMERLLSDAEKVSGIKYDISSYADIVDAIKVVQDEMGITGTTAKEASATIEGSISSFKAAWENVLTGLVQGDSLGDYIEGLVDSAKNVLTNIIPAVEQIFENIPYVIDELLPVVLDEVPKLINEFLPELLTTGANMLTSLVSGITENIDEVAQTVLTILELLVTQIIENLPMIIEAAGQLIIALAEGIGEMLPELIPEIVEVILTITQALADNGPLILEAGAKLLVGLIEGIINSLPLLEEAGKQIINKVQSTMNSLRENALTWGHDLIDNFIQGITDKIAHLGECLSNAAQTVADFLGFSEPKKGPLSNFHTYAPDMMNLFAQGIAENEGTVTDQIAKSFNFGEIGTFETADLSTTKVQQAQATSNGTSGSGNDQQIVNEVNITLEGDAKKLFKVIQQQARTNYALTGQASFT